MSVGSELGAGGRVVAACLATVWIGAGIASLAVGLRLRPGVVPVVLGLLAVGYGWLWVEVARTGQKRPWPFHRA
ncbi:MAG: hypothetical protein ACREOQ_21750 [Gemmatimonadales bacterium]